MANAFAEKMGPILTGDRPMPQCVEAEKAVLSCLLLDPSATLDIVFSKLKSDTCFFHPPHRKLYSCLGEMRGSMIPGNIDIITVTAALERRNELEEIGGDTYLNHLLNIVPTTANIEKYIECVLDAYVLRSLIATSCDIVHRCYDADRDIHELIDTVEQDILRITEYTTDTQTKSIRDLMVGAVNYLENLSNRRPETIGLSTGFDIDKKITGLKPGELIVLAARPSIGKTALAVDIARNVALGESAAAVGFFSLEMGDYQVVLRLLCGEARINLKDVRDGRITTAQWTNDIMQAADRLRAAPIFIDDTPQLSSVELRQKARRLKQDHNIKLIIIDYLQLMRPVGINKNTSREQEVSKLSADIKALAKELEIPVLLLCQLNRQAEQGNRPKLSHLRESGAIEQDADIVMLLHRDREVDVERSDEGTEDEHLEAQLIIAKNRNGETGIIGLRFKPEWTRFFDMTYVSDSDVHAHAHAKPAY